jgi:hypothetical protein
MQKRQIPDKGFAHFEKTISQVLNQSQNLEYIADIHNERAAALAALPCF